MSAPRNTDGDLTVRERKFVEGLASGKSQTQAFIDAGYSPNGAAPNANRLMQREHVRQHWANLLEEAGLGDANLVDKLRQLTDARLAGLTKDGTVVDMGPDNHVRQRTMDMLLKVRDVYPNPKLDVQHQVSGAIVMRSAEAFADDPFIEGEAREIDTDPGMSGTDSNLE